MKPVDQAGGPALGPWPSPNPWERPARKVWAGRLETPASRRVSS